jgi:hypothetical protein
VGSPYPSNFIRCRPSIRRGGPGRKNHAVRRLVRATRYLAEEPEAGDDGACVVGYFWSNHFPRSVGKRAAWFDTCIAGNDFVSTDLLSTSQEPPEATTPGQPSYRRSEMEREMERLSG